MPLDRETGGEGRAVDSLCPYCGVGCQIRYHLSGDRIAWAEAIDGPANRGRLCVKGRFGWDYIYHPDRLTAPLIRRAGATKGVAPADPRAQFREASWEEALDRAADGFRQIKDTQGPQALGGFGTAKGSNEEAYLVQKLIRTGFGTNSVDHCARLCHSSSVVALFDQIGSGGVTAAFTQCDNADVLMVVGTNSARSHPVAASFFRRAVRRGAKMIVIDPRRSEMAEDAEIVVTHRPGSDIALFNALAHVVLEEGLHDCDFIENRTTGFAEFQESVKACTPESAEQETGIPAGTIRAVARLYAGAGAAMVFWGMGVTQHVHGVSNARGLINLALICGHVGRPGTGLHPLRGQNNVQGVSDMALLPNFLPGYGLVAKPEVRARFAEAWGSPVPEAPGLTIVEMINGSADGSVRGLYFVGENPAMSDPDANHVRNSLTQLDHLVVQDIFLTETAWYADVVLPAAALLEKSGSFTNTNRQIQISRPVTPPPGEARQDWWITQELGRRLGLDWTYEGPGDVWEEARALWPAIAGVPWSRLARDGWCQYPCASEDEPGRDVLFGDRFPTADGLAKLVPVEPGTPDELPDEDYPFVFITGRVLEHWHTGAMTRRSAVLDAADPEPGLYVGEADLQRLGLTIGDEVRVISRRGEIVAACRVDPGLPAGAVFMPFCFAEAAANLLTNAALDPQSKIPEYKYCAVRLEPDVAR